MIVYTPPRAPTTIPVIDLSGSFSTDPGDRKEIAWEIHKACRETGFFYVSNHRVPQALIDAQFACARRFFDLPLEQKTAMHMRQSPAAAGYAPMEGQILDSQDAASEQAPPDLKESLYIAMELPDDHPWAMKRIRSYGHNQWPAALPGFREQTLAYQAAMRELGNHVFAMLALSLELVCVGAIFQKDPQVLIAWARQGNDSLAALKGKPIMISANARANYWQFLRVKFGYTDDQIRPYTFSMAPFLADKAAIMQGYLTNEPFKLEKSGASIVVHLLAASGYSSYANVIETSWKLVNEKPDLVQRFVNATIEGHCSYLYGDPGPGNALIKKDNPDMPDENIAYAIATLKQHGIVDSGDSEKLGIGAMIDARWKEFHSTMVEAGVYAPDLDVSRAYTTRFVNKKHGMQMKSGRS